jgi:tRNA(fMet)-specific endonuclease VapC
VKYLLDTDSVSFILRNEGGVAAQFTRRRAGVIAVSVITFAELHFGIDRSGREDRRHAIEVLLGRITVLDFDQPAARIYARIAADLMTKGTPLPAHDAMIAAQAMATKRTLISHNTKHFSRIAGLHLDDWY